MTALPCRSLRLRGWVESSQPHLVRATGLQLAPAAQQLPVLPFAPPRARPLPSLAACWQRLNLPPAPPCSPVAWCEGPAAGGAAEQGAALERGAALLVPQLPGAGEAGQREELPGGCRRGTAAVPPQSLPGLCCRSRLLRSHPCHAACWPHAPACSLTPPPFPRPLPSPLRLQLVRGDDPGERVVMQFGKAEQDAFILDFNPTGGRARLGAGPAACGVGGAVAGRLAAASSPRGGTRKGSSVAVMAVAACARRGAGAVCGSACLPACRAWLLRALRDTL